MKVLVTGGSGFIGSHVVDRLRMRGDEPKVYDLMASPFHAPDEIETVIGDLNDAERIAFAMQGCDAAIHMAAVADVNHVATDPAYAELVNARGTLNVLEGARQVELGRVVYASTIWVYSGGPGDRVDETTPIQLPDHVYTATKLAGELYCRSYAELFGVDTTIMRLGIPYGPRARGSTVLAAFVRKAMAGEPLTVAGEGDQSRRFVYVEDLAEGITRGLAPNAANSIYNLVGEESVTILEIASIVREIVGNVDIVHTEPRPGDFGGAAVSGARAASELDWMPTTPFAEGARRFVEWFSAEQAERAAAREAIDSALS